MPSAARAGSRARPGQAIGVESARWEDFQLQQLGRLLLPEAQGGAAALDASHPLRLEPVDRLAACQQPPVMKGDERPETATRGPLEWAEGRPRLEQCPRR
jgi:hypothetical protein